MNEFLSRKIKVVNFILTMFILYTHSRNVHLYENVPGVLHHFQMLVDDIVGCKITVGMFFAIAGFLFYRGIETDSFKSFCKGCIAKIKKRIRTLLVPYFFWNLADYIAMLTVTAIPFFNNLMISDNKPFFSLSELLKALLLYKYNGPYWFMFLLICYSGVSFIWRRFISKKTGIMLIIILLMVSGFDTDGIFRLDMLLCWLIGGYLAVNCPETLLHPMKRSGSIALIPVCCGLLVLLYIIGSITGKNIDSYWYLLLFTGMILACVALMWFAFDAFVMSPLFDCKLIKELMRKTFFIYSAHPLLMDGLKKTVVSLTPHNTVFCIINYLICPILILLVIVPVSYLLENKCVHLWNVCNGNRGISKTYEKK